VLICNIGSPSCSNKPAQLDLLWVHHANGRSAAAYLAIATLSEKVDGKDKVNGALL